MARRLHLVEALAVGVLTDPEAIAAVLRIAGGNFRLLIPLSTQAARIQEIDALASITPEVVVTARKSLIISTR